MEPESSKALVAYEPARSKCDQMTENTAFLKQLIVRMNTKETVMDSRNSVSWAAYREAEMIADTSYMSELTTLLKEKPDASQRRAIYFVLAALGRNTSSLECAEILIYQCSSEPDKYALASLFDELAKIPEPMPLDLTPIYKFLSDKRWLVRHAAIRAIGCSSEPECETQLLKMLVASNDPYDLIYVNAALNRIGTARALPAIRANFSSRKRDVRISAQLAVEAIEKRVSG